MRIDEITRRDLLKGAGAAALTSLAGQSKAASKWVMFFNGAKDRANVAGGGAGIQDMYFDRNSIVRNRDTIEIWIKLDDSNSEIKLEPNRKEPFIWEINPDKRLYKDHRPDYPLKGWIRIRPDDIVEQLMDALRDEGII